MLSRDSTHVESPSVDGFPSPRSESSFLPLSSQKQPPFRYSHVLLGLINHTVLLVEDTVEVSPPITGSALYDQLNELMNIAHSASRLSCPKTTKLDKSPSADL